MAIIINFKNPNSQETVVDIFRSTSPLDSAALPETPIVSLSNGETSYRDNDVEANGVYHYMVRTTVGSRVYHTPSLRRANVRNTGPGPQELMIGDEWNGYYGVCTLSEIVSVDSLRAVLWSTAITPSATENWFKLAVRGKTIFVPSPALSGFNAAAHWSSTASVQAARNPNYVALYKTGDAAADAIIQGILNKNLNVAAENQITENIIINDGNRYMLRLPRYSDTPANVEVKETNAGTYTTVPIGDKRFGEVADIFYFALLHASLTVNPTLSRVVDGGIREGHNHRGIPISSRDLYITPSVVHPDMRAAFMGSGNVNYSLLAGEQVIMGGSIPTSSSHSIFPVLELIEE